MPAKKPPTGTDSDLNLATMASLFVDEDKARKFVESKRWPNGPACPHCQSAEVYTLTPKPGSKSPVRPGVYKCKACRQQFTCRVGTIFEDSKISISKWLMAIHLMTSNKKGVSSHQIAREVGITQKSAWFLCHRIREAMKKEPMAGMLSGTVEVDESYVGGKPRPGNNPGGDHGTIPPRKGKRGRGTDKQPVMVLVERDGNVRSLLPDDVKGETLRKAVLENVDPSATIMTDELPAYRQLRGLFKGGHHTVNHGRQEYVRYVGGEPTYVSTNTAESWFALLKRAHYGIHHQMSKKHLIRYCTERCFMWDHRKVTDGERMVEAIKGAEGRRLMYKEPA